jgi:phospholipid/cholesterol/gamma-HCH transport system substrate-binding protein
MASTTTGKHYDYEPTGLLPRLIKNQLALFVIVTAVALAIMAAYYVRIPEMLGIGRYELSVQLPETGDLYARSVVTYRGHEVGTVEGISLNGTKGVVAHISIDNGVEIPKGSKVQVRSASVIGEQYLNFQPDKSAGTTYLQDGDTVPASLASIPVSTSELLNDVSTFLNSVPLDDLRTTVDELGTAFSGNGQALGKLIDEASSLQQKATDHLAATLELIRTASPVLATQEAIAPDFRTWASNLSSLTSQLATSDTQLRQILTSAAPLASEAEKTIEGLAPVLPTLVNNLSETSQVLQVYVPSLEHILIVLPAAVEGLLSSVPLKRRTEPITEVNLSFKLNLGAPAVCTKGFPLAGKFRSPQDTSYAPPPPSSYCKVAPDDPRVPRGARNQKCPNAPNLYGPTAASCGLIFQQDAVTQQQAYDQIYDKLGVSEAVYDDKTGQLVAPNGQFFLLDSVTRTKPYVGIGDLMTRLTTPDAP